MFRSSNVHVFFYCSKILIVLSELTPYERSFVVHGFLLSNESVVLSRWESETKIPFRSSNELIKVELLPQ